MYSSYYSSHLNELTDFVGKEIPDAKNKICQILWDMSISKFLQVNIFLTTIIKKEKAYQ